MKKGFYIVVFLLVGVLALMLFASCKDTKKIYVDQNSSYYDCFEIDGDKVFISCYITLSNNYDEEKTVMLSAKLPQDVTVGLLKKEEIWALNKDGSEMTFFLPPNSSKAFDVVFVGEFAGINQKYDRNLPKIDIKEI